VIAQAGSIAVVPARGGSKGLPRKNLTLLAGRPMLSYTVTAALESGCFDRVVVSSDDDEILRQAEADGAEPIVRPANLARDDTPSDAVVAHVLESFRAIEAVVAVVALLQPTSPLRTARHIGDAWRLYEEKRRGEVTGVMSVTAMHKSPYQSYAITPEGLLRSAFGDANLRARRQDMQELYQPNGAIYIFSRFVFERAGLMPRQNMIPYIMSPSDSVDIDGPEDLEFAEWQMQRRRAKAGEVMP